MRRWNPQGHGAPTLEVALEAPRPATTSARREFLIVDESPSIRRRADDTLQTLGVGPERIRLAATPQEGLETFELTRPGVVLMELDWDEADGVATALRILERDPHVRLIALTSIGRQCDRVRRVVRAGAFAVLEKPLRHHKIRAILTELDEEDGGIERVP